MKSSKGIFDPAFWERDSISYEDLPTFQEVLGTADLVGLARRIMALENGSGPVSWVADTFETSCKIAGAARAALSWEPNTDAPKTIMIPYAFYRADVYASEIKCLVMPGWIDLADVAKAENAILQHACSEAQDRGSTCASSETCEHNDTVIKTRVVEMFPIKDVLAARVWLGSNSCSPSFVEDFLAKVIYEQFPESLGLNFEFDEGAVPYRDFNDCEGTVIGSNERRTAFGHLMLEDNDRTPSLCEEAVAKLNDNARLGFLWRLSDLNRKLEVVEG